MIKKIVLLFLLNLFFSASCFSQKNTIKKDSVKIYHDIHKYSQKGKFSKFVYRLFFRSSKLNEKINKSKETVVKNEKVKFNGKIIRNINIKSLDPFGYSIDDSTKIPKNNFEKFVQTLTKIWDPNYIHKYLLLV